MLKLNSIIDKLNSLDRGEVIFFSGLILVLSAGWVIAQGSGGTEVMIPQYTAGQVTSVDYDWDEAALAEAQSAAQSAAECCQNFDPETGASDCDGGCNAGSGPVDIEGLKAAVIDYYAPTLGNEITVDVADYGCHQEVSIYKDGEEIKHLVISGGQILETG